jgi:hypothetical protein
MAPPSSVLLVFGLFSSVYSVLGMAMARIPEAHILENSLEDERSLNPSILCLWSIRKKFLTVYATQTSLPGTLFKLEVSWCFVFLGPEYKF